MAYEAFCTKSVAHYTYMWHISANRAESGREHRDFLDRGMGGGRKRPQIMHDGLIVSSILNGDVSFSHKTVSVALMLIVTCACSLCDVSTN
jgi:hypothetical protein